jgi:hypothetical protein
MMQMVQEKKKKKGILYREMEHVSEYKNRQTYIKEVVNGTHAEKVAKSQRKWGK